MLCQSQVLILSLLVVSSLTDNVSPHLFDWSILDAQYQPQNGLRDDKPLIIVALDGFRHDFLTASLTPFMFTLANLGVWAPQGLQPQIWTETAANFVSLTTGLHCDQHGIVGNFFYDPVYEELYDYWNLSKVESFVSNARQAKYYTGTPLWQLLRDGQSGAVRWPTCDVPYNNKPMGAGCKAPFLDGESWGETVWKADVDTLVDWLHSDKPRKLAMLYIPEPDATEHANDIFGKNVSDVIRKVDNTMQYLFLRLAQSGTLAQTNIIILADHGHTNTISPVTDIRLDKVFADNNLHYIRSVNSLFPIQNTTAEQLYQALKMYQQQHPSFDVYRKEDLPRDFHYSHRRVGDVVVLEKLGYHAVFDYLNRDANDQSKSVTDNVTLLSVKGEHGFNKYYPEMHALFLAYGPDFKRGYVVPKSAVVDNTDIYALVCMLLKVPQSKCPHQTSDLSTIMQLLRSAPDKSWA